MCDIKDFYNLVMARSIENMTAFNLEYKAGLYGKCVSTLREELDNYIRVMFVRRHPDRNIFIKQTFNGERWRSGKNIITDRDMLTYLAVVSGDAMDPWEMDYIYTIGCFFIHLSAFHNYKIANPFDNVSDRDKENIVRFIKSKHGHNMDVSQLDINHIETIIPFLPCIMSKIHENLLCKISNA